MFCHKCGNKAIEDSTFCQKCGSKLIIDEPVQQPVESVQATVAMSPPPPPPQPYIAPQPNPQNFTPPQNQQIYAPPPNPQYYAPPPQMQIAGMSELLGVANLCRALGILRIVGAGFWVVIVILQIASGEGFGTIVWNIISIIVTLGLGIGLFPGKHIEEFKKKGHCDINDISGGITGNIGWSVLTLIWYGYQIFADGAFFPLIILLLEIAIIIIGIVAFLKAKSISPLVSHTEKK